MALTDWSTTAGSNTSVGGVSIAEGMSRASVNNAIRGQMAEIATWYGQQHINLKAEGCVADGATDDLTLINSLIAAASTDRPGLTVIDGGGFTYAVNGTVLIKDRIVLKNCRFKYTGNTNGAAVVQMGTTGGGSANLVRPAAVVDCYVEVPLATTATGLVGFRMDSYVRNGLFERCWASMNENATGTYGSVGFELVGTRIAAATGGVTGLYQSAVRNCTAYNAHTGFKAYTRGTSAEAKADAQANGNIIEGWAYACVRSAIVLGDGANENDCYIRADTFVTQSTGSLAIYVAEVLGGFNSLKLIEEIGTRANTGGGGTQYSVRVGPDAIYNDIEYHTQNVVTARVLNNATDTRNVLRWMRPTNNLGDELVSVQWSTHSSSTIADPTTEGIRLVWIAPAPCVIVRMCARLDANLAGGNVYAYFGKNGSFTSTNRIAFATGEGTTAKFLDSDVSAGSPISSEFVLAKGDRVAIAFTNSGGGAANASVSMFVRIMSSESDG